MNDMAMDITIVTVNLLTEELTRACYESLRQHYPAVPVILVDNGSQNGSTEYIRQLGQQPNVTAIINECNRGHGPALHQATLIARTRYVFTLDSDCEIQRGGFLELMLTRFRDDPMLFALSQVGLPYSSAVWALLFDREKYSGGLRPFQHRGSPAHDTLTDAKARGYRCEFDFPLTDYILHHCMGTRRLFGGDGRSWRPTPEMVHQVREKRVRGRK